MNWVFPAGLVALAALGVWLVPQARAGRVVPDAVVAATADVVGISGAHTGSAETARGDVVTEIETITGVNDGMTLVGRRVDLHVDVQDRANHRAFWVGSRDNRILVVLERDTPSEEAGTAQPRHGRGSHRIVPVVKGQRATISGVIRRVPNPEDRHGWSLTARDETELSDRKIYIRADTVSSEGHGHGHL